MPWMPVDTVRLLDSDLFAVASGDAFKAAVALWCRAWRQVPASSLPNDDRVLANISGAGIRWKKVKESALRGFVKCSDGRLYHPVIAEKALEAWAHRRAQRERAVKRWQSPGNAVACATAMQGTGTGTGTGQDKEQTAAGRVRDLAPDGFEILWRTYPRRAGNNPKRKAEKAYRARIAEKHTPAEMLDGAGRYAKFIRSTGKEGTEFVMMTSTFLGPDKPFEQPWTDPKAIASRPADPVKKPCLTERCENDGDIHLGGGLYVCAKCYLPPQREAGSRTMVYPEPLRSAIERARQAKEPA